MGLRILSPDLAVTAAQVHCNCHGSVWYVPGACSSLQLRCSLTAMADACLVHL